MDSNTLKFGAPRDELERLSSPYTHWITIVLPWVVLIHSLLSLPFLVDDYIRGNDTSQHAFHTVSSFGMSLFVFAFWGRFKAVWLYHDKLFISSLFRLICVSLSDVEKTQQSPIPNSMAITITLKKETAFGVSICFMPEVKNVFKGKREVFDRLNDAVKKYSAGPPV